MRLKASLFILIIFLSSCRDRIRLKKQVFEKVELGMTKNEVKEILGEPYSIRLTVDSLENYYYYIKKSFLETEYASVKFDKSGRVAFSFYGNPD